MDVGEVLSLLDEREVACRVECDRLQAEADRIAGLLSVCQAELERLVTARGVIGELASAQPVYPAKALASINGVIPVARAGEAEVFGERVLAVLAEWDRPVRCRDVVTALGQDPAVARHVERVRHRLKKLRDAGCVAEIEPGVFTLTGAPGNANR